MTSGTHPTVTRAFALTLIQASAVLKRMLAKASGNRRSRLSPAASSPPDRDKSRSPRGPVHFVQTVEVQIHDGHGVARHPTDSARCCKVPEWTTQSLNNRPAQRLLQRAHNGAPMHGFAAQTLWGRSRPLPFAGDVLARCSIHPGKTLTYPPKARRGSARGAAFIDVDYHKARTEREERRMDTDQPTKRYNGRLHDRDDNRQGNTKARSVPDQPRQTGGNQCERISKTLPCPFVIAAHAACLARWSTWARLSTKLMARVESPIVREKVFHCVFDDLGIAKTPGFAFYEAIQRHLFGGVEHRTGHPRAPSLPALGQAGQRTSSAHEFKTADFGKVQPLDRKCCAARVGAGKKPMAWRMSRADMCHQLRRR